MLGVWTDGSIGHLPVFWIAYGIKFTARVSTTIHIPLAEHTSTGPYEGRDECPNAAGTYRLSLLRAGPIPSAGAVETNTSTTAA